MGCCKQRTQGVVPGSNVFHFTFSGGSTALVASSAQLGQLGSALWQTTTKSHELYVPQGETRLQ